MAAYWAGGDDDDGDHGDDDSGMIADDDVFSAKEEDEFAYRRPLAQNHYFAGPFLLLHWFSTNMVNH